MNLAGTTTLNCFLNEEVFYILRKYVNISDFLVYQTLQSSTKIVGAGPLTPFDPTTSIIVHCGPLDPPNLSSLRALPPSLSFPRHRGGR